MLNNKVNAQQGFHPTPLWLPSNAIPPEQVLRHHRSERRAVWGDRHCPLHPLTCTFNSHPDKRNFQSLFPGLHPAKRSP